MVQKGVHTALKCDTEPIRYVTLHLRDRRGAASLRYRNRAKNTVNRSPIRYDFRAGAKGMRYSVKIA